MKHENRYKLTSKIIVQHCPVTPYLTFKIKIIPTQKTPLLKEKHKEAQLTLWQATMLVVNAFITDFGHIRSVITE